MDKDSYLIDMYKKLNGVSKSNFSDFISNAENSYSELGRSFENVYSELSDDIWRDDVKNTFNDSFRSYEELLEYCSGYYENTIIPISNKIDELTTKLKAYNDGVGTVEDAIDRNSANEEAFLKKVFENISEWFKDYEVFKADIEKYYRVKAGSGDSEALIRSVYDLTIGAYNEHGVISEDHGNQLLDFNTPEGKQQLFDFQNKIKTDIEVSFKPYYAALDDRANNIDLDDLAVACYECIRDINKLLGNTGEVSRLNQVITSLGGTVAGAAYGNAFGGLAGGQAGNGTDGANGSGAGENSSNGKEAITGSKIHYISTGASDAILIESNGHFGLVDASNPYNDGTHEQVSNSSHSVEHVISYLNSVGVKTLDFLIGTHAHSDHIGGVPKIAANFVDGNTTYYYRPYTTTNEDKTNPQWDNAGYYNRAISAMSSKTSKLVNVTGQVKAFNLGDFTIKLLNTEPPSANELVNGLAEGDNKNSIVQLITYKGKSSTLLAADMEFEDEAKVANAVGHVEILKIAHHGYDSATGYEFVNKLSPRNIIITNAAFPVEESTASGGLIGYFQNKMGTNVYLTGKTANAIIVNYDDTGYNILNPETLCSKMSYETQGAWVKVNGKSWLYIRNGKPVCDEWLQDNGKWYFLSKKGVMVTGWQELEWQGAYNWYYFDSSGAMVTGWQQLGWSGGTSWFYFNKSGAMLCNTRQNINGKTYIFDSNGVCTNP